MTDARKLTADQKHWLAVGAAVPLLLPIAIAMVTLPTAMLRAFVVATLWNWYLPRGFGLPPIGYALSFGIVVLVGALCIRIVKQPDDIKWWTTPASLLLALLVGWFGTFFL